MPTKFSAAEVFAVYKDFPLAEEKIEAIEKAPFDSPSLVVAGAGSGKTELLSVRVMYLVANSIARPEQILGLTFTKKAANELGKRIHEALVKLRDSELWPEELEFDFLPPSIMTYNAFANQVFKDAALSLGYESDSTLITEASAFKLATEICLSHAEDLTEALSQSDIKRDALVGLVIKLAQALNDNDTDSEKVSAEIGAFTEFVANLPKKVGEEVSSRNIYIEELLKSVAITPLIAELASRYQAEKRNRSLVDYSDQIFLAHRGLAQLPELRQKIQSSFSQVLLDEYQDTSVLQARFLSSLFRGGSVYAVGDPNQSIYGWRGASAANLDQFANDFGSAKTFSLQTSWRNPISVLQAANLIATPLSKPASFESAKSVSIKPVTLEAKDEALEGEVLLAFDQDIESEVEALAKWMAPYARAGKSCAVLMRKKQNMALVVEALQREGVEVEVVGLGGLLELPEIVDLHCALKVIQRSDSGSELIRLLTGARWRIGVKDIDRLHRVSRILSGFQQNGKRSEELTLVEALDASLDEGLDVFSDFSTESLRRIRDAATLFSRLRRATSMPLADFIRMVAQELWLDIELLANPRLKNPLGHLGAFYEIAAGYGTGSAAANLSSFLDWLDFASDREKLEAPKVVAEEGKVQVVTVHSAKGLEWEVVAIPNLVEDDFPSSAKGSSGWLSKGELPYRLRGDAGSLPVLEYQKAKTQLELKKLKDDFVAANKELQLREEVRLMYVALTRASSSVRLSGSYWKRGNSSPRKPSRFLVELAKDRYEIPERKSESNPLDAKQKVISWPLEPLSNSQRQVLDKAAEATRSAIESLEQSEPTGKWHEEIDLLLAEAEERLSEVKLVELPTRIPASKFKDFISDPNLQAERYLRPTPSQPYRATALGTKFHSWVEEFLVQENFEEEAPKKLEQLGEVFKASRFANLIPKEVELEINLSQGVNTFVCKLDAVFEKDGRYEIVDWKTGEPPSDEEQERNMTLQLALYRFAYSLLRKIPIEQIDVCFFFVSENKELRPTEIPSPIELMEMWERAIA